MKIPTLILIAFAFIQTATAQSNIGTITRTNSLGWEGVGDKFHIYLADINATNFSRVATVTNSNRWPGDSTKNINGQKLIYVISENGSGISDPSQIVIVTFRAGVPLPPTNIQIYSVVMAAATNSIPPAPPMP